MARATRTAINKKSKIEPGTSHCSRCRGNGLNGGIAKLSLPLFCAMRIYLVQRWWVRAEEERGAPVAFGTAVLGGTPAGLLGWAPTPRTGAPKARVLTAKWRTEGGIRAPLSGVSLFMPRGTVRKCCWILSVASPLWGLFLWCSISAISI